MGRGWTSAELSVVTDDDRMWTVAQAACLLGPPCLPVWEVRLLARRMEPVGKRRTTAHGRSGRYARVYRAKDFIQAYEQLSKIIC